MKTCLEKTRIQSWWPSLAVEVCSKCVKPAAMYSQRLTNNHGDDELE